MYSSSNIKMHLRKHTIPIFVPLQFRTKHHLTYHSEEINELWGYRERNELCCWSDNLYGLQRSKDTSPQWEEKEYVGHGKSSVILLCTTIPYNQRSWETTTMQPRQSYKCPRSLWNRSLGHIIRVEARNSWGACWSQRDFRIKKRKWRRCTLAQYN